MNCNNPYLPKYLIVTFFMVFLCLTTLQAQDKEIEKVFYFTGNTELSTDATTQTVLQMITQMSQEDEHAAFVALGNITQNGYPATKSEREKVENGLRKSVLEPLKNFNGDVVFIPGRNEWNKNGHENLDDMESFIQDNSDIEFWPNDGCVREIEDLGAERVELLMIDSQWFLEDWDDHLYINNECEIKNREDFFAKFKDDLKDEQNKTVIVAIHHSILTQSRMNLLEKIGGFSKQDYYSRQRQQLAGTLETLATLFPDVIFVSASDRNLQYIEDDGIPQIISGASGRKLDGVRKAEENQFSAKKNGFAKLTVYKDRSSKVAFYGVGNTTPEMLFEKTIKRQQTTLDEVSYPDIGSFGSSYTASIYTPEETEVSGFYRFLWGEHYRDLYSRPIEAPVLNLDELPDNVRAISEGGGNQSRSIRLIDDNEHEYTARELRKSAVRFIQSKVTDHYVRDYMQNTIAEDIIQDFYTTAQPYAPFALNPIFDSLDIYNAEPKIYYLPKQKRLGIYNEDYGNKLYMFEAHAGDENKSFERFGDADDIISTKDLIREITASKKHKVDESNFLKARLMDFLIGDYDRHYDQWRWSAYEEEEGTVRYRTIRRDRDQAFPKYDGIILGLLKMGFPAFRPMEKYDEDVNNVKWLGLASYPLDQAVLKDLRWEDWEEQVAFIQENLTDATIDNAFATLPEAAQDESTENIKRNLKARRDKLPSIAKRFYEFMLEHQVITGIEEEDTFVISRKPNGKTTVTLTTEEGETFERTYDKSLTKELWIYGLDGDDTFKVEGKGDAYIPIKVVGGENNDVYDFDNNRRVKAYDYKSKKNTFVQPNSSKWLVDSYDINTYSDDKRKLTTNTFLPSVGFDPDAGFKVGVRDTYTTYGMVNNPFATQHTFTAQFYSATSGFDFSYTGEFAHIFHQWNFIVDARYTSPNFAINYFGTGNETTYDDDAVDRDFNRVRIAQWSVAPSLKYRKNGVQFSIGPVLETHNVEYKANEATGALFSPDDDVFNSQYYAGAETHFHYGNKSNQLAFIRRGFQFDLVGGYKTNIDEYDNEFTYIKPTLSVDYPLHESGIAVLATKLGAHINFGENYEFYHGATVGGNQSIRGFRNERFNGKAAFYQSTDLRVGISKFKTNFIPIRLGVTAGFDYGRVWTDNSDSEQWHNSYGGSVFINGFSALTANIGYYLSDETNRLVFSLGFTF